MNIIFAFVLQLFSFIQPEIKTNTEPAVLSITLPSPSPTIIPSITPSVTPSLTPKPTPPAGESPKKKLTTTTNSLLTAVNAFRKENNLGQLSSDPLLCKIAQERIQALIQRGSLDNHEGYPQYRGVISKTFKAWWETLFFGSPVKNSHAVVSTYWANSPGHRNSLLSSATHGCGAEKNGFAVFELGEKD